MSPEHQASIIARRAGLSFVRNERQVLDGIAPGRQEQYLFTLSRTRSLAASRLASSRGTLTPFSSLKTMGASASSSFCCARSNSHRAVRSSFPAGGLLAVSFAFSGAFSAAAAAVGGPLGTFIFVAAPSAGGGSQHWIRPFSSIHL